MATNYEYILSLNDKMSAALKKAGVQGGKVYNDLENKQNKLNTSSNSLLKTLGRIGAVAAVFSLGKKIITAGAEIEQTRVAFGTFLGDMEKGNKIIAELNEFSNVTPFQNDEVIKAGRSLLAAQIPAEKITSTLKSIGDVAAGANIPLTDLSSIYAKAMNKGKVQAEELNQLAERGVPILSTFADMYGVTTAEVMKMGSAGQLTSGELEKAFKKMTSDGGLFHNMMAKQSKTLGGLWSTFVGKLGLKLQKLGEKLLPFAKVIVGYLMVLMDGMSVAWNWLKDLFSDPIFQTIAVAIGAVTVAILAYNAAMWLARMATIAWTAVQWALNAAMTANPVGIIVMAVIALIAAIAYVIYKIDGWGETWDNTIQYMILTGQQMGAWFNKIWINIKYSFQTGFDFIKKGWYAVQSLWDKEGADAGLAKLKNNADARVEELKKAQEKIDVLSQKRKDLDVIKLTWNDKSFQDVSGDIKKAVGLDTPIKATDLTDDGLVDDGLVDGLGKTSKDIAGGGSRSTNVTINLGNLVETMNITAQDLKEGADQITDKLKEALLRVLNSANGVAYGN